MKKKFIYLSFVIVIIVSFAFFSIRINNKITDLESKIGDFNYGAIKLSYQNLENINAMLDKEFTSENYDFMLIMLQQSEAWLNIGFLQKSTDNAFINNITTNNLNPKTPAEYFDSVKDSIDDKVRLLGTLSNDVVADSIKIKDIKDNIKTNILRYKSMLDIIEKAVSNSETNKERTVKLFNIFNTDKSSKIVDDLQEIYREVLFEE